MKILLIEDDGDTADYIASGLQERGFMVDGATQGLEGLALASGGGYDLMIIDRMLPEIDGLAIVQKLRGAGLTTPILILTTMAGVADRVEGLNAGADDYLTKPFAFEELVARVNALCRRTVSGALETTLKVADLQMNLITRIVSRAAQPIELQPQEFKLLEYLMRNAGQIVTRSMLLKDVWDFHFDPRTNIVETNVSRLRGKVDRGFNSQLIHTVRGVGYCLRAPD